MCQHVLAQAVGPRERLALDHQFDDQLDHQFDYQFDHQFDYQLNHEVDHHKLESPDNQFWHFTF
jgi:hypothetical protein